MFTCSAIKINIKQYLNISIVIVFLSYHSRNLHPFAVPVWNTQTQQEFLHSSLQPLWTHLQMSEQPQDMALQEYQKGPAPIHSYLIQFFDINSEITFTIVMISSTTTYAIYLLMVLDKLEKTFFFWRTSFLLFIGSWQKQWKKSLLFLWRVGDWNTWYTSYSLLKCI